MPRRSLTEVSIIASPPSEDAVAELLGNALNTSASIYHDLERERIVVSAFTASLDDSTRRMIASRLRLLSECGLAADELRLRVRRLKAQDWAESWKLHFRPINIAGRLLVKASWHSRRTSPGQRVIIIDPGLSFGTGQHPTTEFCLRELVRARRTQIRQSALDIGTGSGILAIAAAKLGYAEVSAFDFDADSVRVARENAAANDVTIQIRRQDLTRLPLRSRRKFDLICANLISDLLVAERARIVQRLSPAGTLVLAGILRNQFGEVQQAYEALGLELARTRTGREWISGAFVFRGA